MPPATSLRPAFAGGRTQPSLWLCLVWLVVTAAALTAVEIVWTHASNPDQTTTVSVTALGGFVTVVLGAVAWALRPSNGTGALLYLLGFTTIVSTGGGVGDDVVASICVILTQVPIPVLGHLVLAFPAGLRNPRERAFTAASYVAFVLLGASGWWLVRQGDTGAMDVLYFVGNFAGVVYIPALLVLVLLRPRASTNRRRRTLALVQGGGLLTLVCLLLSAFVLRRIYDASNQTIFFVQSIVFVLVPFYFAAGMLRGIFGRTGEIEELGALLGTSGDAGPQLRAALADTLGDPSLELLFRSLDGPDLIDPDGVAGALPEPGSSRAHVEINGPTGPIGAIVYDTAVVGEHDLVEAAARVVALAVDRERLTADLKASQDALRRSRARLVDAGDQQRRQFAQDLHDLLQSRLLLAAMHAGALAVADGAPGSGTSAEGPGQAHGRGDGAVALRAELDGAITELRRLVHGVMPALLVERGLMAALEDLVGRLPLPTRALLDDHGLAIPPAVATNGYFIVAEALANAVKHSGATRVTVSAERVGDVLQVEVGDDGVGGATLSGAGLRGMSDRVGALAGTMVLDSRAGRGTSIRVELPCVS